MSPPMMARAIRAAMASLSVLDFIGGPFGLRDRDGKALLAWQGVKKIHRSAKGFHGLFDLIGIFVDIGDPFDEDLGLGLLRIEKTQRF